MAYSTKDFEIGDNVHHLSNKAISMIVIEINNDLSEISCRWIDKNGQKHLDVFLPQELGKKSDLATKLNIRKI